jgi:hypothetical protein
MEDRKSERIDGMLNEALDSHRTYVRDLQADPAGNANYCRSLTMEVNNLLGNPEDYDEFTPEAFEIYKSAMITEILPQAIAAFEPYVLRVETTMQKAIPNNVNSQIPYSVFALTITADSTRAGNYTSQELELLSSYVRISTILVDMHTALAKNYRHDTLF